MARHFDFILGPTDDMDPATKSMCRQRQKARREQLRRAWGEEKYQEFEQAYEALRSVGQTTGA